MHLLHGSHYLYIIVYYICLITEAFFCLLIEHFPHSDFAVFIKKLSQVVLQELS